MVDGRAQVGVEHRGVYLVLRLVEGMEQEQKVEWGVGMCQRVAGAMIEYALGFQEHISD